MVCLRNVCINTLHKGDSDDDDDDDDDDNNNNNISCNTVFPRDMVCLGNICINIPHTGDNDDNIIIMIIIPIVISSTGVIPTSLSQSLKRLDLHPNTYIQMQKSVILCTCSIVRNFPNYK